MNRQHYHVDNWQRRVFTSMIDVVLLLLLFTVLRSLETGDRQITANLARKSPGALLLTEIPLDSIEIIIQPSPQDPAKIAYCVGNQWLSDTPGAYRKIAASLRQQCAGNSDIPVMILPAAGIDFEHLLYALDGCYEAQMTKINFGTLDRNFGNYHLERGK